MDNVNKSSPQPNKVIYYFIANQSLVLTSRDYSVYEFISMVDDMISNTMRGKLNDFYTINLTRHNEWVTLKFKGALLDMITMVEHAEFIKKTYTFFVAIGVI